MPPLVHCGSPVLAFITYTKEWQRGKWKSNHVELLPQVYVHPAFLVLHQPALVARRGSAKQQLSGSDL